MHYDVVIAGASIAGCMTALCCLRLGLSVAVVERRKSVNDYKQLCTHFIQPHALPVLRSLDLESRLEYSGAVRTRAAFWTQSGWIDPPGDYLTDNGASHTHAYNIERRRLDPMLRSEMIARGASLYLQTEVESLRFEQGRCQVHVRRSDGSAPNPIICTTLVAADGRSSRIATLMGNPTDRFDNHRAACFAYFEDVAAPILNRSLFLRAETEMGFLYPLCNGRTLLAAYVAKSKALQWRRDSAGASKLVEFIASFHDVPDLRRARLASRVMGYSDYPNLFRNSVHNGVAFVGDAALSLDPMSGVGCGFAIVAAHMLAAATYEAILDRRDLTEALARYRSQFDALFLPHALGIRADSLIGASMSGRQSLYRLVVQNPALQRDFIALTGRIISPRDFQQSYLRAALSAREPVSATDRFARTGLKAD
jgi:flavin-dependent dehydrogenase